MPAASRMMAPAPKPTYAVMVSESIKALGDRTGSSVQAITKHLMAQYKFDINKHALSKAIKKGVAAGNLVQIKSSYKLAKPIKPAPKKVPVAKKKAPTKAKASAAKKAAPKKVSSTTKKATALKPVKTLKKKTAVKVSRPVKTTKKAGTSSTSKSTTRKAPAARKKTAKK